MNKVERRKHYSNIKNYVGNRRKHVRFGMHPNLERDDKIVKDLAFLSSVNHQTLVHIESEVLLEDRNGGKPKLLGELDENEFWGLVFSSRWQNWSIRVCEGRLLDKLLDGLHAFTEQGTFQTYKMARFDTIERPVKSSLKNSETEGDFIRLPVKITFTYFAIQESDSTFAPMTSPGHHDTDYQQSADLRALSRRHTQQDTETHTPSLSTGSQTVKSSSSALGGSGTLLRERMATGSPSNHTKIEAFALPPTAKYQRRRRASTMVPIKALERLELQVPKHNSDGVLPKNILAKLFSDTESSIKESDISLSSTGNDDSDPDESERAVTHVTQMTATESMTDGIVCFQLDPLSEMSNNASSLKLLSREQCGHSTLNRRSKHLRSKDKLRCVDRPLMTDPKEHVIISDDESCEDEPVENKSKQAMKIVRTHGQERRISLHQSQPAKLIPKLPRRSMNNNVNRLLFVKFQDNLTWEGVNVDHIINAGNMEPEDKLKKTFVRGMLDQSRRASLKQAQYFRRASVTGDIRSIPLLLQSDSDREEQSSEGSNVSSSLVDPKSLNKAYSITRMRRIARHNNIKKSITPAVPQRQRICEMLEQFFEKKLESSKSQDNIPKSKHQRAIKLNPHLRQCQPLEPSNNFKTKKTVHIKEESDMFFTHDEDLFPQPMSQQQFRSFILKTVNEFKVQKEQVTLSDGWSTVTTMTIHRREDA